MTSFPGAKEFQVKNLESQIQTLIRYLLVKVELQDWHAVSDAANDLRELEIKIKVLNGSND